MKKKKDVVGKKGPKIGTLFFALGAVLAIGGGLVYPGGLNTVLSSILIAFGVMVGLLNVTLVETKVFLLATVSLVVMSALGGAVLSQVPTIGIYVEGVLLSILTFTLPAGIIVALKTIYKLAEN